jgi:hypothetical protein
MHQHHHQPTAFNPASSVFVPQSMPGLSMSMPMPDLYSTMYGNANANNNLVGNNAGSQQQQQQFMYSVPSSMYSSRVNNR